jgi:hypothetical protein
MHFLKVSFQEAVQRIVGHVESDGIKHVEDAKPQSRIYLSMRDVLNDFRNLNHALGYYQARGLTENYAKTAHLGYRFNHKMKKPIRLQFGHLAGREIERFAANRYAIPVFCTKPNPFVKAISLRLDVEDAKRRMELIHPDLLSGVYEHAKGKIAAGSESSLDAIVHETLFGDKYLSLQTSKFVYQWWTVMKWDGKQYTLPHHDYVLLMEGQFDAALPYIYAGIPALAIGRGRIDLARMLRNVDHVYIVRDNDPLHTDQITGELYCPGHRIGDAILKNTGRTIGKDADWIDPFPEHKDLTDTWKAGALADWLAFNKLKGANQQ